MKLLRALLPLVSLLINAGIAPAQSFKVLRTFTGGDGANPSSGLVLSDDTLYGTTSGAYTGYGTVFKVNVEGTGFTNLHTFTFLMNSTNRNGARPYGDLLLSGDTLYGTARDGGSFSNGTVSRLQKDGTGFTNLHSFTATLGTLRTNSDGARPYAGLILSGNTLYGTTQLGGSSGNGTVYAVDTGGTGFTALHSFTETLGTLYTNSDGANPYSGLIFLEHTLYGTALSGGSSGKGTVFKVNTDGSGFTTLHSFVGSNGAFPYAGLVLASNTLYGTTQKGGNADAGTVYALNTNGSGFKTLHSFSGGNGGAYPIAQLILSDYVIFGTASAGGSSLKGTLFKLKQDGSGFTNLHHFFGKLDGSFLYTNSEGAWPYDRLVCSGNILYGVAPNGGTSGYGTLFSFSFGPQLTIVASDSSVALMWPTNHAGFDYAGYVLQSATNFASPTVWTTVSPARVVVNGKYTVTNPISGTQQFYRLIQ